MKKYTFFKRSLDGKRLNKIFVVLAKNRVEAGQQLYKELALTELSPGVFWEVQEISNTIWSRFKVALENAFTT